MAVAKPKRAVKKPQTSKRWVVRVSVITTEPMTRAQVRYALQSIIDFAEGMSFGDGVKSARVTNADIP